jgi:acetyl esterase/lipase
MAVAANLPLLLLSSALAAQSQTIPLWPNGAPGSEGKTAAEAVRLTEQGEHIVSSIHRPSITPYIPATAVATGAAVIVIPGGGHRELWMDHEGYRVGQWLSDHGIAAFVLKYRLAREPGSSYTVEGNALADAQRAIRLVRSRASEWHIAADRIGVMGFSAGGELAALAGTRYDAGSQGAADLVDRESSRPAFMGLIYPSIPRDMNLSKETPPAFLLCGANDSPAISEGVPALFLAIKRAGGSAEMHILTGVGHGFGIRDNNPPAVANWTSLLYDWLEARGIVTRRTGDAQLSPQMRTGIASARPVPVYSASERANAVQTLLKQATPPVLGAPVSLTPNMASAQNGAHLSFWKPSFVLGTPGGGEAGINFWGVHNEGHVNVGFTANAAKSHVLDCRLLSAGAITYKVYAGASSPRDSGVTTLNDNHFMLIVPASSPGASISVELWPTPTAETLGFLGCDLSTIE